MAINNLGRPALFTPTQARSILEARKAFDGIRLTTAQFIDQLVQAGDLETHCSVVSMRRLLNGTMFPSLKAVDAKGNVLETYYDYSKVPSCAKGRPPGEERVDRETGAVLPVFTKRQKQFQEHLRKITDRAAIEAGAGAARQEIAHLREQWGNLYQEHTAMRREYEQLRKEFQALKDVVLPPIDVSKL